MRRALVIGAETGGLRGVVGDALAMRAMLVARHFVVDLRVGGDATRAGILAGWDGLIASARDGDAAVIYYSGHGGLALNTRRRPDLPDRVAYLVPTDDQGRASFAGVSEWELSFRLQALTMRTRNVVTIHDCCHAEAAVRGDEPIAVRGDAPIAARSLSRWRGYDLRAHFDALIAHGARIDTSYPRGNPDAVRLAAAGRNQLAWETMSAGGVVRGNFTRALLDAIEAIGDAPVTWAWLAADVRARIGTRQRPEIQGPADRLLFSLASPARGGTVPVWVNRTTTQLAAGRVRGVAVGDTVPVGRLLPDGFSRLGAAKVVAVAPFSSTIATPIRDATAAQLGGCDDLAERLRQLVSDGLSADCLEITWGTVLDGAIVPASEVTEVADGAAVALELTNRAPHPICVHVFHIGAGDRVTRLSELATSGLQLDPGAREILGTAPGVGLTGFPISASDPAGLDELLVIATTVPIDLRDLATPPPPLPPDARTAPPPFEYTAPLLAGKVVRHARLASRPSVDPSHFAVLHLRFACLPGRQREARR